jgi:hypothetical protein
MRGWLVRVGVLLALAPITASADTIPSVILATPGTDGSAITRFTLRFSAPMVPLGQGVGRAPISMECAVEGAGRWIDPDTYVWEFEKPLPGDTACTATLRDDLETLSGDPVRGTQRFEIDSGGPYPRAILPRRGWDAIEEDQVFLVAVNGPVDRASITSNAYCAVDGIGERIPLDLLPGDTAERVLTETGERWASRNFLEEAGLPSPLPDSGADRTAALANMVAVKCRRPLPPGRDMSLVWGKNVRSPSGRTAGEERRFDFEVRRAFAARLVCSRVNAGAGCNPLEPIRVLFTAPVPRAQALSARLDVGGGTMLAPVDSTRDATLSEITFKPPVPPAVTARLHLPADLRDDSGRTLSNGRRFPLAFEIASTPPLVKFAAPFGILEAKEGAVLPVTVRGVEPELQQRLVGIGGGTSRIEADDAEVALWVRRVARAQQDDIRDEGTDEAPKLVNHTGAKSVLADAQGVRDMRVAFPGKGREFEVVGVPLEKPGFYVVELASPELGKALLGRPSVRYVSAAALVTDMAVHFKWGRAASLAWVTTLSEGKPVAGAAIRITDSCSGRALASGTTDKNGRLAVTSGLPEPSTRSDCEHLSGDSPPLMVSARKGGDFSFTLTTWGDGIRPFDFDLPYGWSEPEPIFHSIMDRTLLRAGETVHMKHVYRMPTPSGFRSGEALSGTLVLEHRGSSTSYELPLSLDENGIGETEWTPPEGTPSGDYDIRVEPGALPANGEDRPTEPNRDTIYTGQSVRVDEYRLPTMRASVSGPKAPSVRPKQLPLDLYVGYLSGGGAPGAPVKLRTAWEAYNSSPDGWEDWTFGGRRVAEGRVPMDEDGSDGEAPGLPDAATIPLSLDASGALRTPFEIPALDGDARLFVEMDYQDANGETLTASTRIPIYASAIRLGIKSDGWVQRAGDMRLKVVALTLDGRPIRGQAVRIALYTREILSARRRLIGGFYAYDNVVETKRINADCSGTTDGQGLVGCRLDPGVSGEVIAVATTNDPGGNEARAVTSLYLAGDDEWWFGGDNGDRMDIIPDAKAYRSGDTARIQVRMPFRKATALVTVEREGVLSSFVTELSGKDPVIKVPLAGSYAPDVYISVMAVRGRVSSWRVWLAELAEEWNLPFVKRIANPTALVDLAKPSYRIGIARVKVGWEGHQLKVAVRPEKDRYHVRDTARAAVQVLGPDGRPPASAEIAFAAVDEALLTLSPNESWKLLDAMMGERPLSVLTATAQMQVVGKRHYGRKAVAAGGGGGGDLTELVRTDFRPVLLWRGRVALDAKGRAQIDVPLADTLSAYRLVAVATAGGDLFGTGSAQIRTVQDLTLYSGLPPLVRSGDEFGATFTLRNGTDRPMEVTADAQVEGRLGIGGPQTVRIPAGGAVPVTWRLTAPDNVDRLRWTVTARSADGRSSDRIQIDERVVPAIPVETWAASFLQVGSAPLPVAPPPGALPGQGGIDVALSDSPAPSLLGVRRYMGLYPYGCFEQRLSKAMALDDRAAWADQTARLPAYLSRDGLLRYWPGDSMPGSVALTAYALSITAEAGWDWPEAQKSRMIEALKGVVDGRVVDDNEGPADRRLLRLQALAALARNGAATPAMIGQTAIPVADMPTAILSDWLMTLDRIKGAPPQRRTAAEAALRSRIVYEGTRLDIVDKALAPWWMMVSDDEMALKALLAAIGRRGWEAEAPRMMIGVALRQQRGHWDTTPANAWGTLIVRKFDATYPRAAAGTTTGRLGAETFTREWPARRPAMALAAPAPMSFALPVRAVPLILSHSASPKPWATVSVRAAVPLTAPAFAGYRLSRQVSFVERKREGALSAGDVLKIRIEIQAPVDRTWVVIEDPIPAGATIVSGGGGQSAWLAAQASGGNGWPSYIERSNDAWRGYFGWLPKGRTSVEYVVRVNGSGRFLLPPTRAEAMYSPEIHAALPNRPLVVQP